MADTHFDLSFDGTLVPDADPLVVHQQLGALFRLDDAGVARLFTGRTVLIKRAVDAATAAKFERAFVQAGAVLAITPCTPDEMKESVAGHGDTDANRMTAVADTPSLMLAPQEDFLEPPRIAKMPDLDLSSLSLVSSPDWTLEDCQPTVAPAPVADISHLALVDIDIPKTQDLNNTE